jgi:hypothetical protein
MLRKFLLLSIFSCGLDNSTLSRTYTFYFPAYVPVENMRMDIWTRYWVEEIERNEGIDVTDAESVWLKEFVFTAEEEMYFIDGITVNLGSANTEEVTVAWADEIDPMEKIELEVDPTVELLDYAHVPSAYVTATFDGTYPNNDVDVAAKATIEVEATLGMACSIVGGLGQRW